MSARLAAICARSSTRSAGVSDPAPVMRAFGNAACNSGRTLGSHSARTRVHRPTHRRARARTAAAPSCSVRRAGTGGGGGSCRRSRISAGRPAPSWRDDAATLLALRRSATRSSAKPLRRAHVADRSPPARRAAPGSSGACWTRRAEVALRQLVLALQRLQAGQDRSAPRRAPDRCGGRGRNNRWPGRAGPWRRGSGPSPSTRSDRCPDASGRAPVAPPARDDRLRTRPPPNRPCSRCAPAPARGPARGWQQHRCICRAFSAALPMPWKAAALCRPVSSSQRK